MCAPRAVYQQCFSFINTRRRVGKTDDRIKVAVCGVSSQSIGLCNLLSDGFEKAELVGIISDDISHLRREIHGIAIIGLWSDLDVLKARYGFQQIWLGTDTKSSIQSEVDLWCIDNGVEFITLDRLAGFSALTKPYSVLRDKAEETSGDKYIQPPSKAAV